MNKTMFWFCLAGAVLLLYGIKRIKIKYMFPSAACGLAALIGVNTVAHLWNMCLPVNAFTACVSALGGIPGVILLVVLKTVQYVWVGT